MCRSCERYIRVRGLRGDVEISSFRGYGMFTYPLDLPILQLRDYGHNLYSVQCLLLSLQATSELTSYF